MLQKSLDKTSVHGAVLGGPVRMAPSGSNWPASGGLWTGSSLSQPGTSWTSSGLGPPGAWIATPGPSTSGSAWPSGASPTPNQPSGAWNQASVVWQGTTSAVAAATPEVTRRSRPFNIHQRLRELYLEECRNGRAAAPLPLRNLKRGSRLLEKLVERDNLNTLIVNLYAGNKGYSLSLRLQGKLPSAVGGRNPSNEPVLETMQWPYSDDDLLQSLDREELPTNLVDILEGSQSKLFYQGCIIAEVRDYRHTYPQGTYETHHVLLKPTTQSIINDVNMLSAAHDLSAEERLALESQIVQATAPPLCLDPNPAVGMLLNNMQGKKHRWSTAPLRRTARKFSQVTVNRKRKLDQFTAHDSLQLYDFIAKKRAKANQGKPTKKILDGLPAPPPVPRDDPPPLAPPLSQPDVFKYARAYDKPEATNDCTCNVIEEYILETERTPGVTYLIRLSVLQRLSSLEYLGQLYVDKDYNREGSSNGASCRFVLGSLENAQRYIKQFREIFTEEGRKSVRITHLKPGQRDQVTFTPSNIERQQHVALQNVELPKLAANATQQLPGLMTGTIPTSGMPKPVAVPSVSQLTHLLKSAAVPPNVNVQQIQQSGSTIQSILSGALTGGVISSDGLTNGPSLLNSQSGNATVHYQPSAASQATPSSSKPARPVLNSNPQIAALATSLRNSVEQFEMQVASQAQAQAQVQVASGAVPAPAAASTQNPTILSLLNAGPALPTSSGGAAAKLVARKATATRIQSLPNNVNKTLLVNNNQQLRVTLSSFPNQLVGQTNPNQAGQPQQGFTLVTTQASQSQPQTYSLSSLGQSQGFTLAPAQNSQTFTVLQPNQNFTLPSVQSQTFQIPAGTTGPTFTITAPVVTVASQFQSQTATPGQVFTVNIPQTSQSGGKGKSFTIQAAAQTFAKSAAQRRVSTTFQSQSELTKLLGERGDSRAVTERHIGDKDGLKIEDVRGGSSLGLSMPGLSALLANTPSADNPIPGSSSSTSSTLLERLSTPTAASFTSPPPFPLPSPAPSPIHNPHSNSGYVGSPNHSFNSHSPLPSLTSPSLPFASPSPKSQVQLQGASPSSNSPLSSPPQTTPVSLNLQGLSLQGLSGIPSALQLSIPGIAVPISLSLNVSGQGQGVLMTSLPVAATTTTTTSSDATMVLSNSSGGQISVAQLMSASKNSSRPQASISMPQGTGQSIQLVSALQRPNSRTAVGQMAAGKNTPIAARGVADHRPTIKVATNSAAGAQIASTNQIMALSPQQFQLLQKHGIQGLSLSANCLTPQKNNITAAAINSKHRRRSSAADQNK